MVGRAKRRVLTVVMDGVGVREDSFGNAVAMAATPYLDYLKRISCYTTLKAHGTAVGLPSDADMGNSEVGHNALGGGRIFDQGAKLVGRALESGSMFDGDTWTQLLSQVQGSSGGLHFLGLLSDGNVHSHEAHLHALLRKAVSQGVKKIRLHVLFDGRDVAAKSAETYVERLEVVMVELRQAGCDVQVASGGGRMHMTMDRYEADWAMVQRGWEAHVHGKAPLVFRSVQEALSHFRRDEGLVDQNIPAFVIEGQDGPVGPIQDGDGVVLFNFRGDRAIEISQAFDDPEFSAFDRGRVPQVFYAGMMEYDGDLHIPRRYLVEPPAIDHTLGEVLCSQGIRQFACSETQKYGHVTYFWNGNRSGYFDDNLEEYVEIPSDTISFDLKPWMKAQEITDATVERIRSGSFDFGRINFANGDMVGHTGNLEASIIAMGTVDLMIGRLIEACRQNNVVMMVVADHGNCDEMFEKGSVPSAFDPFNRPKPKTSHTLNQVPFYLYDPSGREWTLRAGEHGIGAIAGTALKVMGLSEEQDYLPTIVE